MSRMLRTTRCRESRLSDYFRENASRDFCWSFGMPRRISFGLRFLRQHAPGVSILEGPSRSEYAAQPSRGWDAVGFSFYLEETNEILDRVRQARAAGIPCIWAVTTAPSRPPSNLPSTAPSSATARKPSLTISAFASTKFGALPNQRALRAFNLDVRKQRSSRGT